MKYKKARGLSTGFFHERRRDKSMVCDATAIVEAGELPDARIVF